MKNFSYDLIRQVMKENPAIKAPKDLARAFVNAHGLILSRKQKRSLQKTCWDLLNRRKTLAELEADANTKRILSHSAKILVFDIETAPLVSYTWRRWQQNVFSDQAIHDDWPILTYSAKWLCEEHMIREQMTVQEALKRDDARIVKKMWNLLEEADIVIAHNAKKFDVKMINARFWLHGLTPPSSYQVIDTLLSARKAFALPSMKLDDLCKYRGMEGKIKTDFSWWKDFLNGDQEAIDRMATYNDQDVLALEELYLDIRPWIRPHPNLGLFIGEDIQVCNTCGGKHLTPVMKPYATTMNMYQQLRCDDCGGMMRNRLPGNQVRSGKKSLLSSLPR